MTEWYKCTHTHTDRERERERKREKPREWQIVTEVQMAEIYTEKDKKETAVYRQRDTGRKSTKMLIF